MSTLCINYGKLFGRMIFSDNFRNIIICYELSKYNLFYATDCLNEGRYGRYCASLFGCWRAVQASA